MSIASEISALTADRNDIRSALVAKGVTGADEHGFDSFATDIAAIPTGSGPTPTGTISIVANGSYDVGQYASASVNVPSGGSNPLDGLVYAHHSGLVDEDYTQDEIASASLATTSSVSNSIARADEYQNAIFANQSCVYLFSYGGNGSLGRRYYPFVYAPKMKTYVEGAVTVTNYAGCFYNQSSLVYVPEWNIAAGTTFDMCFASTGLFDIPEAWDFATGSACTMVSTFQNCYNMVNVKSRDLSRATSLESCFREIYSLGGSLITVGDLKTPNCTNFQYMFQGQTHLTTVGKLDFSSVTSDVNAQSVFPACTSLVNLGGFTNLSVNFDISGWVFTNITRQSILNIIAEAADMTSNPKTITVYSDTYKQLQQSDFDAAAAKGWTIQEG